MQLKKQLRPVPYEVAGIQYQIHPFAAMDSVAVCGTLMVLLVPVLQLFVPAMQQYIDSVKGKDGEDINFEKAVGNISIDNLAHAINGLSGENLQKLFTDLLLAYGNITFVDDDEVDREKRYKVLNLDYFNEIFCQDLGSAVRLSVKVLTVNFGNFFDGLGIPFGSLMDAVKEKHSQSTESLTQPLSAAI